MTVYRSKSWGVGVSQGAAAIPLVAGRAAVAVRELPDSGAVVRLTRGRAWIAVLGTLLAGIVALNVISLGMTASSGQVSVQVDAPQRATSSLRADIAEKLSATKVQDAATTLGLAIPAPGEIGYLNYSDSVLAQAAKALAGEASFAASSVTPATVGSTPASSSTDSSVTSSTATSAPTSSTPAPSTSTAPTTSTPPPTSSSPVSSSGGGGGVSAGL
jgi:cell division septation protein DedD